MKSAMTEAESGLSSTTFWPRGHSAANVPDVPIVVEFGRVRGVDLRLAEEGGDIVNSGRDIEVQALPGFAPA